VTWCHDNALDASRSDSCDAKRGHGMTSLVVSSIRQKAAVHVAALVAAYKVVIAQSVPGPIARRRENVACDFAVVRRTSHLSYGRWGTDGHTFSTRHSGNALLTRFRTPLQLKRPPRIAYHIASISMAGEPLGCVEPKYGAVEMVGGPASRMVIARRDGRGCAANPSHVAETMSELRRSENLISAASALRSRHVRSSLFAFRRLFRTSWAPRLSIRTSPWLRVQMCASSFMRLASAN
jgi:hypothetical protein